MQQDNHQILLIEGDKISRYLSCKFLNKFYPHKTIIQQETGELALEYIAKNVCPSKIMVTYRLQGMNGIEFIKEFFKKGYECDRISLLTDGNIKEREALGPYNIKVIPKPLTKEKMTGIFNSGRCRESAS